MEKSIDEGYFHVSLECTLQASERDLGWWQVKVHLQEEIHFKEAHHFQGGNQAKNAAGGPQGGPDKHRRAKNLHKQIHMQAISVSFREATMKTGSSMYIH